MASQTVEPWRVVAHNTATQSHNKIHDDEVARSYGFAGGLVPGVDVYAYLTHVPAATWGLDWIARGMISARFVRPVYEGERVTVSSAADVGPRDLALELRGPDGDVRATAEASLPDDGKPPPDLGSWPDVEQVLDRPDASPESLAPSTALRLADHTFRADRHAEYLVEVREDLPLYTDERVAHPGWLLRDANYVLSENVRLGPWIHVSSAVVHHAAVRDGARVGARAVVTREWERKSHRFVELDVALHADGQVAARVTHTAIYQPRRER